jgi:hypothetical protein
MDRKDHISHSQIQAARCLYYYKRVYSDKEFKAENLPMLEGRFHHQVREVYINHCMNAGVETDPGAMRSIFEGCFDGSGLPENSFVPAYENVMKFAERPVPIDKIFAVEKESTISLGKDQNGKEIKVVVKPDLILIDATADGTLLDVWDFKSQRNKLSEKQVGEMQQMRLYMWAAVKLCPGFDYVSPTIFILPWNLECPGEKQAVKMLEKEHEAIEAFLMRQWDRIINSPEEAYDQPTPCEQCFEYGGCPILNAGKCPAYESLEREDIKSVVKEARLLDHKAKQLKAKVKEHYKQYEGETIEGAFVGYDIKGRFQL